MSAAIGEEAVTSGAALARRTFRRVMLAHWLACGVGAVDVFVLLNWVIPGPGQDPGQVLVLNAVAFAIVMPLGAVLGTWWARRLERPVRGWLAAEGIPTARERDLALRQPLLCARVDMTLWLLGAAIFGVLNATVSAHLGWHVATTIFLGGLSTTAVSYLLTERLVRPVTARALAAGPGPRPVGPSVTSRMLLAWVLATGVPLLGVALVGIGALSGDEGTRDEVARSVIVLSAVAVGMGLVATFLVARSLADPLTSVRRALARIEAGELDATVSVDDGSEVGLLQSGFNRMAAGLRERERVQDLFGRHVGRDVARNAVDGTPKLGGEVREVAVIFVDLIGSTAMAARRPPDEVVALLNRFFAIIVETVDAHGGWVNKFEGDAALAVFGAPADHADAAGFALSTARELRERLTRELPDARAGIGVSAGPAVAGNIGAEERFEYTVIGDPVNEAARVCELAKLSDRRVLASEAVLRRAANGEPGRWRLGEDVLLRGRADRTVLFEPAAAVPVT